MSFTLLAIDIGVILGVLLFGFFLEWRASENLGASALARMTPAQLREIASCYQYKITGKAGNTMGRILFMGLLTWIPSRLILALNATFDLGISLDLLVIMTVSLWAMLILLYLYFFSTGVAKLTYILITNRFTGRVHTLSPGFMIFYPWENYNPGRVVTTEAERAAEHSDVLSQRAFEVQLSGRFLSKDGIGATMSKLIIQGAPFLPLALLNIRYDEGKVADAISEIVESTLFQEITERNVDELRTKAQIDDIEDALIKALQGANPHQRDAFGNNIEERTGSALEITTLGTIQFDQDYEEGLRATKTLEMMKVQAKDLVDSLGMEGGEAFNNVQIVHKETVDKRIFTVEMGDRAKEAVQDLGAVAQAAAGIARSMPQGRRAQQRNQGGGAAPPKGG